MFFSWKNEYSVGIDAIDQQHRLLINMINDLYMAIHENKTSEVTDVFFDRLEDYVKVHFATEKRMMDEADYNGRCAHLQKHDEFIAKVAEMKSKHSRGHLSGLSSVVVYLRDWLNDHICKTDSAMAQVLKEKAVR